jgi:hypothetical protein
MERIVDRGIQVLIPPTPRAGKARDRAGTGGLYASSPTRSSTAASTASDDEAEPPSARNGD